MIEVAALAVVAGVLALAGLAFYLAWRLAQPFLDLLSR